MKPQNYVFNVGTGTRTSLKKLGETIYKYFNIKKNKQKIIFKDFRKGDIRHSLSDIRKIKKILQYSPIDTINDGISKTLNWFKFNSNV